MAIGKARDDLEQEMINSAFLNGAPFKWVGLIIRLGLVNESVPHYQKIDQKDGELPLAIEIDINQLVNVPMDHAVGIYRRTTLLALIDIAQKFGLNAERMRALLSEMEEDPVTR